MGKGYKKPVLLRRDGNGQCTHEKVFNLTLLVAGK